MPLFLYKLVLLPPGTELANLCSGNYTADAVYVIHNIDAVLLFYLFNICKNMQKAPILQDELLRLNDLVSHHILDSGDEEAFNELLDIAAHICGCPTALISIVDRDRQWFKSKINVLQNELPRDTSFCGHAIAQNEIFVVEDATKDERFFDNPNVTGDFNIRFYAGAQIVSKSGFNLGTVCVIDNEPRVLNEEQKETLKKIASQVSRMIDIKKQQALSAVAAESKSNFETLFMQSSFPKIIFSAGGYNIIDANEAALKLYGYERNEFLQLTALDIRMNKSKDLMQRRINKVESSNAAVTLRGKHVRKDGSPLQVMLNFSTITYNGHPARLADITDISDRKILSDKIKQGRQETDRKIIEAALKVKQKEKDNIVDALRENINQILACTNLYLGIAKADEKIRLELIDKSRNNIQTAIAEIKKLYRSVNIASEEDYLKEAIEQLALKYELLRSFNVHCNIEGDEAAVPENTRLFIYRLVEEYFEGAFKAASIKNVWLTLKFNSLLEVIIRNDNNKPDTKKRRLYMQKLQEEVKALNGNAELYTAEGSCTLQVIIPNDEFITGAIVIEEDTIFAD
ncbi:MAG: PAS domain S-box protein [Ferruginibacter sp.]